ILPWSSYTETVATALWFAVARAAWAHDVEELLKEDERKLRTAKVERQLEEELRELHGLVAEQQKQLDAAAAESQGLRRELE
ncbi:unnamed protein product, partial [Symbiodinium sp. KB8]